MADWRSRINICCTFNAATAAVAVNTQVRCTTIIRTTQWGVRNNVATFTVVDRSFAKSVTRNQKKFVQDCCRLVYAHFIAFFFTDVTRLVTSFKAEILQSYKPQGSTRRPITKRQCAVSLCMWTASQWEFIWIIGLQTMMLAVSERCRLSGNVAILHCNYSRFRFWCREPWCHDISSLFCSISCSFVLFISFRSPSFVAHRYHRRCVCTVERTIAESADNLAASSAFAVVRT